MPPPGRDHWNRTAGHLRQRALGNTGLPKGPSTITAKEREELGTTKHFPKSISEALSYLEADEQLQHAPSKPTVENYLTVKRAESKILREMEPMKRRSWLIERY